MEGKHLISPSFSFLSGVSKSTEIANRSTAMFKITTRTLLNGFLKGLKKRKKLDNSILIDLFTNVPVY